MSKNTEYNKSTYIGFLKMKKGGMKIIPGEMDTNIINKRNKILNHLDLVLGGHKKLKEKNIENYFKALGGKYVRNDICSGGDSHACKLGKKISLGGADKLLKLCAKKELPMDNILNKFKGSSPSLYKKLEQKITGVKGGVVPDNISVVSSKSHANSMGGHDVDKSRYNMDDNRYSGGYNMDDNRYNGGYNMDDNRYSGGYDEMYGGQDIELNNFRSEIGRLSFEDELNKLRLELKEIRNN
jgi:hypothetical protein